MKKLLLTFVLLVGIAVGLFAQKLTYQAVVRDNNQQLVVNTDVKAFVTIKFSTGTPATYKDTVNGRTNIHGLLSIEFGEDAALVGRDWEGATIAVKVVNSTTPSIVYVNEVPRSVSAVPYALSVNGQSIQNYLTEHNYVDLDKLKDTLNAYPTTAVMNSRHYLTSDSAVITTMQGDISTNTTSIGNLIRHTAKAALRDSVAGQIHDSIKTVAANAHTHGNKALLDTYTQTNVNLADAVTKRHAHGNADILNNTTATYTDADSTKLDGIENGAQKNVNADWAETNEDTCSFIRNKPELFSGSYNDLTNKPSIKDTVNNILTTEGYVTTNTLDGRHYLTSDSAVITTMRSDISTNKTSIQTNAGAIGALATKEHSDSLLLANRITALEGAAMDCNKVKDCIKDTLSNYSTTAALNDLLQQLTARLDAQNAKMDSLARIVDSLSNLTPGGGDTPTEVADGQPCPGAPTVSDGTNTYNTVKIGNQCWMKENLRTTTKRNNVGNIYTNNTTDGYNAETYGYYYDWAAVMQNESGDKVRGICPEGWHVPSDAEWTQLTTYVKLQTEYVCEGCSGTDDEWYTYCIANALSSSTGWQSPSDCGAGHNSTTLNATGFSAVPAGDCFGGRFIDFGGRAYFWSATQIDGSLAWYRGLSGSDSGVLSGGGDKDIGFSVRCLRDAGVGGGTTPSAPGADNACCSELGARLDSLEHVISSQDSTINALNNQVNPPFVCGSSKVKDVDSNEYNTVAIGNQCWLKENLRTKTHQYGTVWTKTDVDSTIYGRYYDWQAAMQIDVDNNTLYSGSDVKHQGICPTGWHVPSNAEWDTLTTYVYNSTDPDYKCAGCSSSGWNQSTPCIAKALSSTTGWNSNTSEDCNAGNRGDKANATGFAAVPAGYCFFGDFYSFGNYACFWSATQDDGNNAGYWRLRSDDSFVASGNGGKDYGSSVRCLRD